MILVGGFNSALDKRIDIATLAPGQVHRACAVVAAPGGKGLHVAQALGVLGSDVHLVGLIDAAQREPFETVLRRHGVVFHGIEVPAIRSCLALREPGGRVTEVLEAGPTLPPAAVAALRDTFLALAADAEFAVLSGSLPPGCAPDLYAGLVRATQQRGLRCAVDASGEVLRAAAAAQPFLVKPNRDEAAALCGRAITGIDAAAGLLRTLRRDGVALPVVSLGAQGALAADESRVLHAQPPALAVRNPVGSGDCLLAGLVHALARGAAPAEALRLGVACGAANALSDDSGHISAAAVADLLPRVQLHALSPSIPCSARR